ncbi:hypothetical protein COLO4_05250 [Corchorus olitorius]|uniref:Uncharacterized protein n=1 Tax=Corchorus olitorius TaxID=93759 RepID=A0A1R3KRL2_9ROSI|nr:hypothetical protein COLO4_05250 [Corchorus olitorius]
MVHPIGACPLEVVPSHRAGSPDSTILSGGVLSAPSSRLRPASRLGELCIVWSSLPRSASSHGLFHNLEFRPPRGQLGSPSPSGPA